MERSELESYKSRLLELRARLIRQVSDLETAIVEDVTAPGDVSSVSTHPADQDSEGLGANVALARNEAGILAAVEAALLRIEQGTFGRCRQCNRPIARDRLEALPYTPYCIACAESGPVEPAP